MVCAMSLLTNFFKQKAAIRLQKIGLKATAAKRPHFAHGCDTEYKLHTYILIVKSALSLSTFAGLPWLNIDQFRCIGISPLDLKGRNSNAGNTDQYFMDI